MWEAESGNDVDAAGGTNEWGNSFCDRCSCRFDSTGGTIVDCSSLEEDLGRRLPKALPPDTTTLLLGNAGLLQFDWQELEPAISSLQRLDVHNNPHLQALPPRCSVDEITPRPITCRVVARPAAAVRRVSSSEACSFANYTSLRSLTMDNTDLSLLLANSFQYSSLRENLDTLSLVSDGPMPDDLEINLSGFRKLLATSWYNTTKCPVGFYSTLQVSGMFCWIGFGWKPG